MADYRTDDDPSFHLVFLFHKDLELFRQTAPRCISALTDATHESYEITIYCDGTSPETLAELLQIAASWPVDAIVLRRRERHLASGAPGNNAHRRLFPSRSEYMLVVEDDVTMYKDEPNFDVLHEIRRQFEADSNAIGLFKLDDHDLWAWKLSDVDEPKGDGTRVVNRVATHFICYNVSRFMNSATKVGAWWSDIFIDRDDWSYNWEDLVSHLGTTGGRRILFPASWPFHAFHCDEKIAPGSMYNTQDLAVKLSVFERHEKTYRKTTD